MHQALFDELTSLPNRTLFMDRLGRVMLAAGLFMTAGMLLYLMFTK